MSGKAIHDDMLATLGDTATLGDNAPAYSVVKSWLAEFKRGRNSVQDEHRSGCPKDAASSENVQIINDMLKEDRWQTIRHTAETTYIHATTVYRTVLGDLGMKRASAHWVHRMLADEEKQNSVDVCTDVLCCLQAQPEIFLDRIVMQDETWVHHFDLETKRQSVVWKHTSSDTLRNSRSPHHGYCFRNCKSVMMTNYLSKGSTVTGAYYAYELHKLRQALKKQASRKAATLSSSAA